MIKRYADVAVIGAGSAGLTAFRTASKWTDKAVLIEGGPYGTTCARVGCMPSKLLIAAADAAHAAALAPSFGVNIGGVDIDGVAVMNRVRRERDRFVGFVVDGVKKIPEEKRIRGHARFIGDHDLQIGKDTILHAKSIVIATGSTQVCPPILKGLGDRVIVNDDVFDWTDLPQSVAVFGPGVIGLELGQALRRLGVDVHIFGIGGAVGPLTDPEVLDVAKSTFADEFFLDTEARILDVSRTTDGAQIEFEGPDGRAKTIDVDYAIAATGRTPNIATLSFENTSLPLDDRSVPDFDPATMRIGKSHVFIAGDVNNERVILHEAADEGRIAGENAARYPLVREFRRSSPLGIVFTEPQIAMVGERFADVEGGDIVIGEASFDDQGRSRVMLRNHGLLRIYAHAKTGRLLGAELFGPRAEHLGHLLAWSHQGGLTVSQMLDMPFYHPVIEEGLRTALRDAAARIQANVDKVA